jgi:hypothetical protein
VEREWQEKLVRRSMMGARRYQGKWMMGTIGRMRELAGEKDRRRAM